MAKILALNGGSSSIRFAVFDRAGGGVPPRGKGALLRGKIDRVGTAGARIRVDEQAQQVPIPAGSAPGPFLLDWLGSHAAGDGIEAVGHRIVHGMRHTEPTLVSQPLLEEIKGLIPFDREHLPREIELIEAVHARRPGLPQVLCFDTAFHRDMPRVAALLPIPRRYFAAGIRRYGFHGLSYTYLVEELRRIGDAAVDAGRVILAHLGSGASLAAVLDGKCLDTSMSFTPTAGLVMGTRSGDLDPGLMSYLAASEGMSPERFAAMVSHESGLLGISETSADVRDLLEREQSDARAAEALAIFSYQARKWIGAFAAALGGCDTLVFAGGIGENSAPVRERICAALGFLGVRLNEEANAVHASCISHAGSRVTVRVIRTDEEAVIAALTIRTLNSA
jgi:acetate kinase